LGVRREIRRELEGGSNMVIEGLEGDEREFAGDEWGSQDGY